MSLGRMTMSSAFLRCGPAVLLVLAAGCGKPPEKPAKTIEVIVTTPITGDVLDYQDFTGRLEAIMTVDIRARVSGYVNEAPFKEGDLVRKGEVLFKIDPRPFKVDLAQADANLQLAIADRKLQELNSRASPQLIQTRSMNKEEYDQVLANREKSKANARVDGGGP